MRYYKVKEKFDGVRIIRHKRSHWYSLIGNELYTPAEFKKLNDRCPIDNMIDRYFDEVELNKFRTYWVFGARFYAGSYKPRLHD